ncbi:MAG: hypothetical protein ACTTKF_01060 [Bacteroides sp.]
MKTGWFTAFLCLALLWVSPAMAKKYDLWVVGKQVTDKNCNDLGLFVGVTVADGGEFHYNPKTNTLTMKDVSVDIEATPAIHSKIKGLKIVVSGENRLKSRSYSLYIKASTFIDGDGSLYCFDGVHIFSENLFFFGKNPSHHFEYLFLY